MQFLMLVVTEETMLTLCLIGVQVVESSTYRYIFGWGWKKTEKAKKCLAFPFKTSAYDALRYYLCRIGSYFD